MTEVYSFRPGPTYRAATREELFTSAMSQPMSRTATFFDQAEGGVLESFGLGTAMRDLTTPEGIRSRQDNIGRALRLGSGSTVLTAIELGRMGVQALKDQGEALDEAAYKSSPYFRETIPWDAGMTDERAASLAMQHDARKVREFYAEKRPITAFIGNLAGQAVDPINYIPIAGQAVKAAQVARFGKVGGAAITSALDAAANTAIFGVATAGERGRYGDDVSWQALISQVAMAALIGGAFGTIGGALGARTDAKSRKTIEERLATLKTTQEARIALNEAIGGLVRGEDVALSPNATEPLARAAADVEAAAAGSETVAPNIEAGSLELSPAQSEARAALVAADYDIKKLEAAGQDVSAVMGAAPLEDAGKTVQRQDIQATAERIAALAAERPVPNAYGPGSRRTDKAPADAEVYETGMGGAATKAEHEAAIAGETAKLTAMKEAEATGTVVPSIIESLKLGRKLNPATPAARRIAVDTSAPRPEPVPAGRAEAETAAAKPDDYKALSAQYQVDPEAGTFVEEADIARMGTEGRLTEDDATALADAQNAFDDGKAYGEALKSVVGCLLL